MNDRNLLERRARLLGENAPLFYEDPIHIVRGEGVWLYGADGRRYLDVYNNVPHVGHCHPRVAEALCKQAKTLNVHNRYLHEEVLKYAERLTDTFDENLTTTIFTCTGTESNEVALRMARQHTQGMGIICTDCTYHGNSTAVWELATNMFKDGISSSPNVRSVPFPDSYRPRFDQFNGDLADAYAHTVKQALDDFIAHDIKPAALIVCPLFSGEGLPPVPSGYLKKAVALVRSAGGLFISDEVQAGFGRTGKHMWGHELHGVTPDIVTMGKPMGNGHPIGGVVTSSDLLNEFRESSMYFNTYGGNPVSCAVGNAVLDVLQEDNLLENATATGEYVQRGLEILKDKYALIGDVRGTGLFFGLDLVSDRQSKKPAATEANFIVNEMRRRGILISKIGPHDCVLKMRPPMPFAKEHADLLLSTLDEVFAHVACLNA